MVRFDVRVTITALNAYLSTPKFVKTLTDISLELIGVPDRDAYLQDELLKLNKQLPAAVYIPFVNGKHQLSNLCRINQELCYFAHCHR